MDMWNLLHALKSVLLMLIVQVTAAWLNVLYKLALNDGMNLSIIVAYRYIFATVFIVPLAFIIERFDNEGGDGLSKESHECKQAVFASATTCLLVVLVIIIF